MSFTVEKISKSFGDLKALDEVSFKIGKGELFGLIGPDGAGKTTLFRILVTLLLPDSGKANVNGMDTYEQFKEIRKIIGYMPGRFSLYQDLSVRENLEFYATVFGTTIEENYHLVKDIYSHIEPFESRLAGRLSGGMKQKLALSCALIHSPEVLILDEPTTGVDAVSRMEFWDMLEKIRSRGITILVSTPYMDEAALCDRVALIQKGKILTITEPGKLELPGNLLLYSFSSEGDTYTFLEKFRQHSACKSAFLFGNEIHVAIKGDDGAKELEKEMMDWELSGHLWKAMDPGIEDTFMELMNEEEIMP
jgi:ABC-2 type transport system ATP-binding protein